MAGKPKPGGEAYKNLKPKQRVPKPKQSLNKRLVNMMKKSATKNPFGK
jgi:hypothetical protein